MQCGLLYFPVYTHGFAVLVMLDMGTMQLFVSHKLAVKLPAIVQFTKPLTVILLTGIILLAILAIQLDMLIDNFAYT